MSGWRRCPRCGSGAVVERTSGCLGYLVGIGVAFAVMIILGAVISGDFMRNPVSTVMAIVFVIVIPVFFYSY
ncbi:hypothetical protein [Staphylococcus saprophyticus]|uniref:hypothetical protein n=1 Tax=Staphylococcus saprophyticus TaxID=29385 RepID=UPI0021A6F43D|nr:hypothetical protein [Staphylococcus saprophyticus]MCT1652044.1 hypothetical protein [Staphylococcus saprophyticus]